MHTEAEVRERLATIEERLPFVWKTMTGWSRRMAADEIEGLIRQVTRARKEIATLRWVLGEEDSGA